MFFLTNFLVKQHNSGATTLTKCIRVKEKSTKIQPDVKIAPKTSRREVIL